jgi:hypothetical protein
MQVRILPEVMLLELLAPAMMEESNPQSRH